jgi:DNA-directed RNA polymerase specialized sigma24 family protein
MDLEHDEETLLSAASSDAQAFAAFYRLSERPVLGFFMRATGRTELAADLTAETFARALESVETYDPARGRADQWLFGIARNVLGASYREGRVESAARGRLGLPRLVLDDHTSETARIEVLYEHVGEAPVLVGAITIAEPAGTHPAPPPVQPPRHRAA